MAGEFFSHLTKVDMDATGLKKGIMTLQQAEATLQKYGVSVAGLKKSGEPLRKIIEQQGKAQVKTTQSFKDAQGNIYKFSQLSGQASKQMGNFERALRRVLVVVPTWFLFRQAMMGVMNGTRAMVTSLLDLQKEMGRVAGVTRGSKEDLDKLRDATIDYGRTATREFKEVATAMYALGSAGLTVSQQMTGFKHIMDLSIGTFGDTEQIAKLVAGAFNVFGNSMKGAYTDAQKFKQIADLLAYTYSTQQVELSEIATAMTYVASVGSLLNISFETLVGTIGVLNTGMLKGSKSGTALMNSFIQLAQKSDRLADLGVIFDPSQPLDFLDVMTQLHEIYGKQTISLSQLKDLFQVFGRRGGRAVAQLIKDFDRWKKTIDDTNASFADFAEEMKEKAEDTLPMAFKKLANSIKADFADAFKGAGNNLKDFISGLTKLRNESREISKYLKAGLLQATPEFIPSAVPGIKGLYGKTAEVEAELSASREIYDLYIKYAEETSKVRKAKKDIISLDERINEIAKEVIDEKITEQEMRDKIRILTHELLKTENAITSAGHQVLMNLIERVELRKEEIRLAGELTNEQKKRLQGIKDTAKYQLLEAQGVKDTTIEYIKLTDLVDSINKKIEESGQKELERVSVQDLMVGNYKSLEEAIIHVAGAQEDSEKALKISLGLITKMAEKTREYADEFRSSMKEGMQELLKGGDLDDFIDTMKNKLKDMWAEALATRMMTPIEGIFGDIGGIFSGLEGEMASGGVIAGQTIKKDFIDASIIAGQNISRALTGVSIPGGVTTPTGGLPSGWLGTGKPGISSGSYPGGYAPAGYADPTKTAKPSLFSRMGGWGGMASIAMGGMSGGWAGAGITALSMINPVLGLIAGGLYSLFGRKKKTVTESTWQPQEAGELFGYQGMNIPAMPKMYPLARERYFGKGGISVNINVDIDKITGTDKEIGEEIAKEIADKVGITISKQYGQDVTRGLLNNEVIF